MPQRTITLNIVTSDYTVVCPDHYRRLRRGCNWRQLERTHQECELCPFERSCGGPAFCLEIYCAFCNWL